jgi:hypothetical protein
MPATHPDGALYFYDEERVRMSLIAKYPVIADFAIEEIVY